jgi:predicted PurR-regulated permease PerM
LIVPRLITQVQHATGSLPSASKLHQAVRHSHGIKHDVLVGIEKRLKSLPHGGRLVHQAVSAGKVALEILVGILFTLAVAAYWIFERERAQGVVLRLVASKHRKTVCNTWDLIDAKLGAFVRGQLLLITIVSTLLSVAFWLDGLPYFLLLGVFAGLVEIVPVVGPLAAAVVSIGVGFTVDVPTAVGAAIAVFGLRLLQDYVINPRVMGHAVGLSPLVVLVSVVAVGYLLGAVYVLIAIPIACIVATVVDVVVRGRDPAEEDAPAVLFAGTAEGKR